MGNNLCCEEEIKKDFEPTITVLHKEAPVQIPELTEQVRENLAKQRPFQQEIPSKPIIKQFGGDVYEGEIDEGGRPQGYGRMYYQNGSVFVGDFEGGVANGDGHYVKSTGEFYHGKMKYNKANDQNGRYWTPEFEYNGGVANNMFDGKGRQVGKNHSFEGRYENNTKVEGILIWKEGDKENCYKGTFNKDGQFHGEGLLKQEGVGEYEGGFMGGKKHGTGEFKFVSGLKYIGEYKNGIREGKGKIVNKNGTTPYEGEWRNGLPNGKGCAPTKSNKMMEREWIDGLDKELL